MSQTDVPQLTPEQEELRQRAAKQLDAQMRTLGEHCSQVTELFEQIIALEEETGVRVLRNKLNQDNVGYTGALKLRSSLWQHRTKMDAYSLEELSELTNQVMAIGDGITTIHTIFEKHFNLINEKKEKLSGKSLSEQLASAGAIAEITKSFTKDVIANGAILSQFRSLTGESVLDKVARSRGKILSTAAFIAALALGGTAKSCDGCSPADENSPPTTGDEVAHFDPDLTE